MQARTERHEMFPEFDSLPSKADLVAVMKKHSKFFQSKNQGVALTTDNLAHKI
jgi:hypothetical protein